MTRRWKKIEHYKKHSIRIISIERGENIADKLRELVPQQKHVDLDIYVRASRDKRIEEIDKEIAELKEKLNELYQRRNQIIDENVRIILSSLR
jgi:prefoldin subunit 5